MQGKILQELQTKSDTMEREKTESMNTELLKWAKENFFIDKHDIDFMRHIVEHIRKNPHLLREDGIDTNRQNIIDAYNDGAARNNPNYIDSSEGERYYEEHYQKPNPRHTDMEQEARGGLSVEEFEAEQVFKVMEQADSKKQCITALTEFGKMWKERGREEMKKKHDNALLAANIAADSIAVLQGQLAEKDKQIANLKANAGFHTTQLARELTAAKEKLAEKERIIEEWKEVWKPIDEEISKHPTLKLGERKSVKVAEILAELTYAKEQIAKLEHELADLKKLHEFLRSRYDIAVRAGSAETERANTAEAKVKDEIERLKLTPSARQLRAMADTAIYNIELGKQLKVANDKIAIMESQLADYQKILNDSRQ